MLKRMPTSRAKQLVAAAAKAPTSDPRVSYPAWYLHRWHFLPEGYLSRRSAAGYDHLIRNLYNVWLEKRTVASVVSALRGCKPSSVLEVGCGPGRLLRAISNAGIGQERVGVDLSPYLLERAAKRLHGSGVRLAHGDGLALAAQEGEFDCAVASHYIGHLPANLRAAAVAELARVVRPGGHLLVVDHRWHASPATDALKLVRRERQSLGAVNLSMFVRTEDKP
jgi:ubiquinone/menaquinone biosynthesis C-methylase UbiE